MYRGTPTAWVQEGKNKAKDYVTDYLPGTRPGRARLYICQVYQDLLDVLALLVMYGFVVPTFVQERSGRGAISSIVFL